MDSLRELAAKASQMEKQVRLFQKRLEEMGDLKQNLKLLEEKNLELMKVRIIQAIHVNFCFHNYGKLNIFLYPLVY